MLEGSWINNADILHGVNDILRRFGALARNFCRHGCAVGGVRMCVSKLRRRFLHATADHTLESPKTARPLTFSAVHTATETHTPTKGLTKPQSANHTLESKERCRPKVFDVHKKLKDGENAKQNMDSDRRKQELEAAMKMLGCDTNTTIIQRLEKAHKSVMGVPKSERSNHSVRQGDIAFTLGSRNKRTKEEDTVTPLAKTDKPDFPNEDCKELELGEENVEEDPNSENYMYNSREIKYTCVEMLRNIDKNILMEATGESLNLDDTDIKVAWNPWAPISVLEKRPLFDCQTLRRNTLISTTLACPTKDETALRTATPKIPAGRRVVVRLPPQDLMALTPLPLSTNALPSSNSLDKTPQSDKTSGSYKSAMVGRSTRTIKLKSVK